MSHKFFRSFTSLLLALAIILAGVSSALAADGSLDPTFGTGGIVTIDFSIDSDDVGNAIAIQPDDKIVMAGFSGIAPDRDFALTRYNSDGSLDPTFDSDGIVTTDFGNRDDFGSALILQPDGKIVVAGESSQDFALARYNSDGALDTTFDADGKVLTSFSIGSDIASAIALQPDGRIIAAGYGGDFGDFALARYNSDGSLDPTFDTDGKVLTDFGQGDDWVHEIVLFSDGKILAAGYSYNGLDDDFANDFALARYNSDGSLDPTFDTDGIVRTDFGGLDYGNAIALQPDGKILVAGSVYYGAYPGTSSVVAVARYNSDGSLDSTFHSDGLTTTSIGTFSGGNDMILHSDGKMIVSGFSHNGIDYDFALLRYNADGSPDSSFGMNGIVTTNVGAGDDFGFGMALQPDSKIVVAGRSFNGSNLDFAVARYDVSSSVREVTIDVKPGRFSNRIELEKHVCKDDDNLYVAILTTLDFDATTVDASTLKLGDPNLSGTATPIRNRARDIDLDGDMDMALAFPLCDLVRSEALSTSSTELILSGMTLDGIAITGRDSVKVVRED